jgi:hypothetical protein
MLKRALIFLKYFRPLWVKLLKKKKIILNDRVFYFFSTAIVILIVIVIRINHVRLKVPFSEVAPCPFEILARTLLQV